jgi:hypothetical protein
VVQEHDANGDGELDEAEIASIRANAFSASSERPIYYGLVNPLTIVLSCATS